MASRTSKRLLKPTQFACYQNETDAYRSNAQTADLDEQRNDCTPEHGEMIRRVDGDEPVTQTALVEVNSASMGVTCAPSRTDTGSISNAAPARITSAKPAAIRRPGRLPFDEIHLFDLAYKIFYGMFCRNDHASCEESSQIAPRPRQVKKGT